MCLGEYLYSFGQVSSTSRLSEMAVNFWLLIVLSVYVFVAKLVFIFLILQILVFLVSC